jgi:synaptic vesicle membrane protein VAT-1
VKAVWIKKAGDPSVLEVREAADPSPKANEVKIRVAASGLNFAEVMARKGLYPDAPKLPCVVGYECAGTIEEVGVEVKALKKGQRVLAMPYFGAHASVVCVPEKNALAIADSMSFEEAAALPVTYLTAYHMLFHVASLREGDTVLVHAAAGGVGIAVAQLAKTVKNVRVFGTASASKHALIKAQGITDPIDYHSTDYAMEIQRATSGRGVDIVLDSLGGKDWKKGYKLLAPAGRLVAYGFSNINSGSRRSIWQLIKAALGIPLYTPLGLMNDNKLVAGVNMGHLWDETELLRKEMHAILRLYDDGVVRPVVDSTFPFERAADAHRRIEERKNVGKVLLIP